MKKSKPEKKKREDEEDDAPKGEKGISLKAALAMVHMTPKSRKKLY